MDWFLHDGDLCHERVKPSQSELYQVTIKSHINCKISLCYRFILQLIILIEFHFTNNKLIGFELYYSILIFQ